MLHLILSNHPQLHPPKNNNKKKKNKKKTKQKNIDTKANELVLHVGGWLHKKLVSAPLNIVLNISFV